MCPERMNPSVEEGSDIERLHFARYQFAEKYVHKRRIGDIACGTGYGSYLLAQSASSVTGIDNDRNAVDYAKSHYAAEGLRFEVSDVVDIRRFGAFDIVVSFETIEHLHDPLRFLRAVKESLVDGGMFILSTPIRHKGSIEDQPENPYHVREWNEEEFIQFVGREFDIIDRASQFVQRKEWFPGSRTIRKFIARLLLPEAFAEFHKFDVRHAPPSLQSVPMKKGYVIVLARRPRSMSPES